MLINVVKCPFFRNPSLDLGEIWPQYLPNKDRPFCSVWSWFAVWVQRTSKN